MSYYNDFKGWPKLTYIALADYLQGWAEYHTFEVNPLALWSYRIRDNDFRISPEGYIVRKQGRTHIKWDVLIPKPDDRLYSFIERLYAESGRTVRVLDLPAAIKVDDYVLDEVELIDQPVYDTYRYEEMLAGLHKKDRKTYNKRLTDTSYHRVKPTIQQQLDAVKVFQEWSTNEAGQKKGKVYEQERYIFRIMDKYGLWATSSWYGLIAYRNDSPVAFCLGSSWATEPGYGVSIISRSLNYASMKEGANGTSTTTTLINCLTAKQSGIRWLNAGPWKASVPSGLKEFKYRFCLEKDSVKSAIYSFSGA